jgi:molybdopterin converting factor small subunit
MNRISVKLFYHLKDKAGTNLIDLELPEESTIKELKIKLIQDHPALQSQLDNIMTLINQKIAVDEDIIPMNAQVSFLTPIGGG